MKKILIILIATGLAFSGSAQKVIYHPHAYYARPRVIVAPGLYYPFVPYYGYYGYHGYPYGFMDRPTRLDRKITGIQYEYKEKIQAARHDKTVPRKQRKENVRLLKNERDQAITQAKRDFYKPKPVKPPTPAKPLTQDPV
jgi:hypothetical protein